MLGLLIGLWFGTPGAGVLDLGGTTYYHLPDDRIVHIEHEGVLV